jgi:hypothetical protein
MQKVAAYLLERRDDMQWAEARKAEAVRLRQIVRNWLASKGASVDGPSGAYQPEDGSVGAFSIKEAVDGDRSWWMVELDERTAAGRRFSVAVSITASTDRVSVYVTLEAGWTASRIMPASVDARCPRIVRELLELPGSWYHGTSMLQPKTAIHGFDAGEGLAAEIEHLARAVPLVVVSAPGGDAALPGIDTSIAYDLAGLANVMVVDQDAAWALTDVLGAGFSCYSGAVRLYWPHFSTTQDRFIHPLWTAERLRMLGASEAEARDRFRRHLRSMLFRAAALSVTRPREIDDIRDTVDRTAIAALRQRATSLEEFEKLADSYAADNDQLRTERADLRSQVESLQEEVVKLEADRQALIAHLQAAKGQPTDHTSAANAESGVDTTADELEQPPCEGEIRFYKKVHSRPTYDVMVRVADCGCNNWQGAHAADKARKGIARIEDNRSDWKSMQHCASCTGGGMWKVRW